MADLYAETQLINCLLTDNGVHDEVNVQPEDFNNPDNRKLFEHISGLISRGIKADQNVLLHDIEQGRLNIHSSKIMELEPFTAANAKFYADNLKKETRRRQLKGLNNLLSTVDSQEPDQVVEQLETKLSEILKREGGEIQAVKETIFKSIDWIEELYKNKGQMPGISTGYHKLDMYTGGFEPGELIIIAARTSVGKSSFSINLLLNQAVYKQIPCGFISCEMDIKHLEVKLIANHGSIPLGKMKQGNLTRNDFDRISKVAEKLHSSPIQWYRAVETELSHIKSKIRQMARRGAQVVYVDYLTLLRYSDKNLSRPERVGEISKQLKALAEELNISIVAMSQVGRQAGDREPRISDLRQSGEVEEDSDKIILLHRELGETNTKVIVGKNRNGSVGSVQFYFDEQLQRFRELVPGVEE